MGLSPATRGCRHLTPYTLRLTHHLETATQQQQQQQRQQQQLGPFVFFTHRTTPIAIAIIIAITIAITIKRNACPPHATFTTHSRTDTLPSATGDTGSQRPHHQREFRGSLSPDPGCAKPSAKG